MSNYAPIPEWNPPASYAPFPKPFPKWDPPADSALTKAPVPTLSQNVAPASGSPISTSNTMDGAQTGNPYVAAAGATADILLTGYNLYNNERARRAQARSLKREITRQQAIRESDMAENNKWKQIEYEMSKEDRSFSRDEYNKVKRIEYFQRIMDSIMGTANNDAQLKQLLMNRLS